MRHALNIPPFGNYGDVHLLVDLAVQAEEAGWDGVFLWDHVLFARDAPFADPWVALAAVAAATERIRLGPLVTPLPRRRPWKVAREAVTVDHLSRGRLVLGVGLGIDFWREYSAFAEPATDDAARARLVDEGLDVIDALWTGEPVTYHGRAVTVDGVRFLPRPVQRPRIPIWTAALVPARAGPTRRASRWDGVAPFRPDGPLRPADVAALVETVTSLRAGPMEGFDVLATGRRDEAAAFAAAGATWLNESVGPDLPVERLRGVVREGCR